ncbi:MAG: hypothetical protein ABI970_01660 [Chloroflexota bacterium]
MMTLFALPRNRNLWISAILTTFLLMFLSHIAISQAQPNKPPLLETLTVPFTKYQAVKTAEEYSGMVVVVVSGVGQASGKDYTDAFYGYTSGGVPLEHPVNAHEFGLEIDGRQSGNVVEMMPDYAADHIYVFTYDAGQIAHAIGFSIGEMGLSDNSGHFTVRVMPLS